MPKKTKTPTEPRPGIPMPARVQESEEFGLLAVSLEGKPLAVVSIDHWEEGAFWEPEPVTKMHYWVTLEDGRELGIFRNYKTGGLVLRGRRQLRCDRVNG